MWGQVSAALLPLMTQNPILQLEMAPLFQSAASEFVFAKEKGIGKPCSLSGAAQWPESVMWSKPKNRVDFDMHVNMWDFGEQDCLYLIPGLSSHVTQIKNKVSF